MRLVTEYIVCNLNGENSQLPMANSPQPQTAVLLSAGLDSAVLAASEARTATVHPIYVSTGLAWEAEELAALDRLLATDPFHACRPVARLAFTAHDLYPATHWALR